MPGRKSDVNDAQWLQKLHRYGLLRASFRPRQDVATLRSYLRQRERLLEYAASHIQHMQKALMQMNVQLHHVVEDIAGVTGMKIIRAIVAGERDTDAGHRKWRLHCAPMNQFRLVRAIDRFGQRVIVAALRLTARYLLVYGPILLGIRAAKKSSAMQRAVVVRRFLSTGRVLPDLVFRLSIDRMHRYSPVQDRRSWILLAAGLLNQQYRMLRRRVCGVGRSVKVDSDHSICRVTTYWDKPHRSLAISFVPNDTR